MATADCTLLIFKSPAIDQCLLFSSCFVLFSLFKSPFSENLTPFLLKPCPSERPSCPENGATPQTRPRTTPPLILRPDKTQNRLIAIGSAPGPHLFAPMVSDHAGEIAAGWLPWPQ